MVLDNLGDLTKMVIAMVVIMAVGFLIVANVLTQIAETEGITNVSNTSSRTAAYNASLELQTGMATIPGWVPLVIVATIGIVLLALTKGLR